MTGEKKKQELFSTMYEEHYLRIKNYIGGMVRDSYLAEDLTQDTFVKAYNHYEALEKKESPKNWLYTIAYHITIDYIRKVKPIIPYDSDFILMNLKDHHPDPSVIMEKRETSEELQTVLHKLKPAYRNVIVLRKLHERTIKETCDELEWSESKVKSTLHRAIPLLEQELRKELVV
ncbi:RNA polymerase sigma factor [Evansella tamaricis]|uniref:RNA polymerase sigma factor n=1 Tax=Evansella tamaricis TaxID=2069301 RepID=A0ABS6JAQ0_9BACI|nr:RNA polymerase sigma factor [Evansella tamaricis]MBU9710710.1 RNA polymerase sigma factor [Evansella tamaricis]